MCSFGSCQMRFEFLSQFRKVRNAFECFVTQVQTHLPKTKHVWPMKINMICTVNSSCQCLAILYFDHADEVFCFATLLPWIPRKNPIGPPPNKNKCSILLI